jgi:hypothetical protein
MRFPYLLPPNQGNQPRSSNQMLLDEGRERTTKLPIVDENGEVK